MTHAAECACDQCVYVASMGSAFVHLLSERGEIALRLGDREHTRLLWWVATSDVEATA